MAYIRPQHAVLLKRLSGPRYFIQVVAGPRQVGKSTLVHQVLKDLGLEAHTVSADDPEAQSTAWIAREWDMARILAQRNKRKGAVLVIDEVQKVPRWSDVVKARWDEDSRKGIKLKVVLLGSSPLLMQQGLQESMAGRFELVRMQQWSFAEMQEAFGWDLDRYVFHGGYPGAARLIRDLPRWRSYMRDTLIETSIARDVLQMTRVDKPALLRRLFELGCNYSGQELSYTKMLGQLQDAGNTTTLSWYGELTSQVGLLTPMQKYAGQQVRRRASSPKWMVHDTGLMTAPMGISLAMAKKDPALWGRIVESAVGAHLLRGAREQGYEVYYWRDGTHEVDFVVQRGRKLTAIEVKSARIPSALPGMSAFHEAFKPARSLLIGEGGIDLAGFLLKPASVVLA
ncbi:MAG: ATP-binding protein [Bacteroidetes bacterium]|nr:ATP-binding protein [Bacteroidota bacterium]MBS1942955.1 ATP-binding protein [Bacteroidota bacterium]